VSDWVGAMHGTGRMPADEPMLQPLPEGVGPFDHLGCDSAQGYGNARPMPGVDMPAWAAAWQPDHAYSID
jgi:hypothetical protein